MPRSTVHELKVTLRDVRPPVWRRLQVPSMTTLGELHDLLQAAFEWHDGHLHQFEVAGVSYGEEDLFGSDSRDESEAVLDRVAARPGALLTYTYDFGDNWEHRIEVEAVLPPVPDQVYP